MGRLKVTTRRNDQHSMLLYVPSRELVQGKLINAYTRVRHIGRFYNQIIRKRAREGQE
ncbi:hypothetical protein QJS10_CPA16g00499 [Acorus calamus]|uniref:Uncharacterized protein n=1 Tax=Acorus calamus TaxID=4465 RepID=A0AAV9CYU5_ACOCL|nr:hypothetical protein QJS10_CPA16g00499 [Acorus calamus]